MGTIFWQWMPALLVAVVGYPIAFLAIRSAKQEKQDKARKEHHQGA